MKTITKITIAIVAILLILFIWYTATYNGLIKSDENVNEKWANVQTAYQRRADLIPNLATTVQKYANYESDILIKVTQARASIGSAKTPQEIDNAGSSLDNAISRLLVVAENYPELKASENFLSLQDELAGTENRIKTERDIYNTAIKEYNIKVRTIPSSLIASQMGLVEKVSFSASPTAQNVPQIAEIMQ